MKNDRTVFSIDQTTGELTPTGFSVAVSSRACVRFVPLGE
jgi:hypothetical protein